MSADKASRPLRLLDGKQTLQSTGLLRDAPPYLAIAESPPVGTGVAHKAARKTGLEGERFAEYPVFLDWRETMTNYISAITDELKSNWKHWEELVDPNCEFGAQVAVILADRDDDKLGRIRDLQDTYSESCAHYAIDCDVWYGQWGNLKRAAGLSEPTPFDERIAA
jgi:hypothetical protein